MYEVLLWVPLIPSSFKFVLLYCTNKIIMIIGLNYTSLPLPRPAFPASHLYLAKPLLLELWLLAIWSLEVFATTKAAAVAASFGVLVSELVRDDDVEFEASAANWSTCWSIVSIAFGPKLPLALARARSRVNSGTASAFCSFTPSPSSATSSFPVTPRSISTTGMTFPRPLPRPGDMEDPSDSVEDSTDRRSAGGSGTPRPLPRLPPRPRPSGTAPGFPALAAMPTGRPRPRPGCCARGPLCGTGNSVREVHCRGASPTDTDLFRGRASSLLLVMNAFPPLTGGCI